MSEKNTYGQILKSTSIMGGAAVVTMIVGMVKTKFAAVLIGAAGVGLLASYTSIQGLIQNLAGLGINSSGVRDVAAAVAKGDQEAIGRAVKTLRRMCWLTGILGMLTVAALSPLIGQITFGSSGHNLEIAALGGIILFVNISGGQLALMQGARRIGDVARVNIISAVTGALLSTGLYFWMGMRGIVPALIISAGVQLIISWHYAKRVSIPEVDMTWQESLKEAGSMVRLGIAMMWTGLVSSLVSYATVLMITNQFDLHAAGLYSAAFTLSGMFVNFVLQAMGADFYPRLISVAHDKVAMNRMVNEQTEIGLLLVLPGTLVMLALSHWLIKILYSTEFESAAEIMEWFVLGNLGRIISWPLGFIILSMGRARLLVGSETLINAFHVLTIWICLKIFGIEGVGVAFFVLYAVHILVMHAVASKLVNFAWNGKVKSLLLVVLAVLSCFFMINYVFMSDLILISDMLLALFSGLLCLKLLVKRVGQENLLVKKIINIPGIRSVIGL